MTHAPPHALPPGPPKRKKGFLATAENGLRFLLDPIGLVSGRFLRYGDVYHVAAEGQGPGLWVFRRPEHAEEIFLTKASAFKKSHSGLRQLAEVIGDGLVTSDGDRWRRQRRLVQPAFSKPRLVGYTEIMREEAERAARGLSPGEHEIGHAMRELTLRIVTRTLFGQDAGGESRRVDEAFSTLQRTAVVPRLGIPRWLNPAQHIQARARGHLDAIVYRLIAARRAELARGVAAPEDLLQALIEASDEESGERLSDEEIRDQLLTLFLAGHETTAHALTWSFYLLGEHPEAEARLHEELERVLGGRSPTYEDLKDLPYTLACFEEAMRLYPPAYTLARGVAEDVEVGGWHIPAGGEVVFWLWHTHHDERNFEEPTRFLPERFLGPRPESRHRLAYMPFGAGARACIGKVFALIEAQLILAELAQRVRMRLVPDHPVDVMPRVTLSPRYGMKMIVERR